MSNTAPVQASLEQYSFFEIIGVLARDIHKAINNPVFLAFVEGVTTLVHKFILLLAPYRFYDFPSVNQAIGRAVIK
ncbi:hypothetical protein [Acinetobacter sp. YH12200]|uniref:hypothetical protein n=1 Tax=Acinetobacter sp. YH12200 TaxID=2601139 RepID=UPI0015D2C581|nr:hypothetical protein [Acinetobacter sp. YH12200]